MLVRRSGGLISRRDHPALAHTMAWLVRQGRLVPVLTGIYAPPELAHNLEVLMRAIGLRHPDAVVLGAAAARASFWPDAPVRTIEVAASSRLASRPGYTFSRRHIPAELIVERAGLRYTAPALTAIDLAAERAGREWLAGTALYLADAPRAPRGRRRFDPSGIALKKNDTGLTTSARHAIGGETGVRK